MFDSIAGAGRLIPPYKRVRTAFMSVVVHGAVLLAIVIVPLLRATDQLPTPPTMLAFVAVPPAPLPPPPPPGPAAPRAVARPRPVPTTGRFAAPIDVPNEIAPESGLDNGVPEGVVGGVEGGVIGGVLGGVVGGLPSEAPAPPPPPARAKPVRIGGDVKAPALVTRVEPKYPLFMQLARLEGLVILEADVDTEGQVLAVRVLRSGGALDKPAVEAVQQWRYSPLTLNGRPAAFTLTVTFVFELPKANRLIG